jgi:hypothetical protein
MAMSGNLFSATIKREQKIHAPRLCHSLLQQNRSRE